VALEFPENMKPARSPNPGNFKGRLCGLVTWRPYGSLLQEVYRRPGISALNVHQAQQILVTPDVLMHQTDFVKLSHHVIVRHATRTPENQSAIVGGFRMLGIRLEGLLIQSLRFLFPAEVKH
jgi:hypothetical protein